MKPEERRKNNLIPFEEKEVKEYLDGCIRFWRKKISIDNTKDGILAYVDTSELDEDELIARRHIDAFQSVRMTLFGKLLPL